MTHIETKGKVVRRNGKHRAVISYQSRGRVAVKFTGGPLKGKEGTMTEKVARAATPTLNPKKILSIIASRLMDK